jgi:hypothetical protein
MPDTPTVPAHTTGSFDTGVRHDAFHAVKYAPASSRLGIFKARRSANIILRIGRATGGQSLGDRRRSVTIPLQPGVTNYLPMRIRSICGTATCAR